MRDGSEDEIGRRRERAREPRDERCDVVEPELGHDALTGELVIVMEVVSEHVGGCGSCEQQRDEHAARLLEQQVGEGGVALPGAGVREEAHPGGECVPPLARVENDVLLVAGPHEQRNRDEAARAVQRGLPGLLPHAQLPSGERGRAERFCVGTAREKVGAAGEVGEHRVRVARGLVGVARHALDSDAIGDLELGPEQKMLDVEHALPRDGRHADAPERLLSRMTWTPLKV